MKDYYEATAALTKAVTLSDLARELKVSDASVRRARLAKESDAHRQPPLEWRKAVARLARERAGELVKLAEELEGE